MIKFAIKAGILYGTVHYLADEGVWRESEHTEKVYNNICTTLQPLVKDATTQLNIEIPDLPSSDRVCYLTKQYWNCGVRTTFKFLNNLPDHVTTWTKDGYHAIVDNPEIQKMFSAAPEEPKKIENPPKK